MFLNYFSVILTKSMLYLLLGRIHFMIAALLENIVRREILIWLVWLMKEDSVTSNSSMYAVHVLLYIQL